MRVGFTPWAYSKLLKSGKIQVVENYSVAGVLRQVLKQRIDGAYLNVAVTKHRLRETLKQEGALSPPSCLMSRAPIFYPR